MILLFLTLGYSDYLGKCSRNNALKFIDILSLLVLFMYVNFCDRCNLPIERFALEILFRPHDGVRFATSCLAVSEDSTVVSCNHVFD